MKSKPRNDWSSSPTPAATRRGFTLIELELDLQDIAAGGRDGTNGHSYEVLSEFVDDIQNRLTQNLTLTYTSRR